MNTTDPEYIPFGGVARDRCGMQCQYASRYLCGVCGYVNLGEGIRWQGDPVFYHMLTIHKDDADTFIARLREHRKSHGCGWSGEEP